MLESISRDAGIYPNFLKQRFPHILQRMVALWTTPGMEAYLNGLLEPVRHGAAGFPEEALVEIRAIKLACCGQSKVAEVSPDIDVVPLRKALLAFLDADHEVYPKALEVQFPHLLHGIVSRLASTEADAYCADLLTAEKQAECGFSEEVLVEIFTIKAIHRAKYPNRDGLLAGQVTDNAPLADSLTKIIEDDHEASMVFDRIHRW